MPVRFKMIQFICQFPCQTESADKAVHGALLYHQVLGVDDQQHQLSLRLVQPLNELPVANFDAYFGTTSFGRKYLKQIPETVLERSETGFGLCRYRLGGTLVIK